MEDKCKNKSCQLYNEMKDNKCWKFNDIHDCTELHSRKEIIETKAEKITNDMDVCINRKCPSFNSLRDDNCSSFTHLEIRSCPSVFLHSVSDTKIKIPKACGSRDELESKAEGLITNDRAEDYGEAKHQFEMVAKVWSGITGQQIEAKHIAACMVGLKLIREMHKHKEDNLVDAIGYIKLIKEVQEG